MFERLRRIMCSTDGFLPKSLQERYIKDLEVGDCGWTVPWALDINEDGKGFLRLDYPILSQHGGTSQMRVIKTEEGYLVDVSRCQRIYPYRWKYLGHTGDAGVEVSKIVCGSCCIM